ncbi:flavoprotein, partial [Desulfosporosinus nitroreducens]|nr:flavoprotein [Desulfosporosinus nitroreducens]
IELVTEYLGLTAQTPQAYRDLYEGYLKKVQTYGFILRETLEEDCTFASDNRTVPVLQGTSIERIVQQQIIHPEQTSWSCESKKTAFYEESASTREEIHFVKKFLGDKQAFGFPEDSRVHVKQGTVISPLARDTLKLRRIELCIAKEGVRG